MNKTDFFFISNIVVGKFPNKIKKYSGSVVHLGCERVRDRVLAGAFVEILNNQLSIFTILN